MYEFNVTISQSFPESIETIKEALMAEQLGVVSDIDVQATFKAKIDKDIPGYRIMGVGTRPAEVCGEATSPMSSRSDMILRMVAGLSSMPESLASVREPTGSPSRM